METYQLSRNGYSQRAVINDLQTFASWHQVRGTGQCEDVDNAAVQLLCCRTVYYRTSPYIATSRGYKKGQMEQSVVRSEYAVRRSGLAQNPTVVSNMPCYYISAYLHNRHPVFPYPLVGCTSWLRHRRIGC